MRITLFFTLTALLACSLTYGQTNTFPANGNVGIGITNPDQKLSVLGIISSHANNNEGGALFLENPLKTLNNQSFRWALYNMTGQYGNCLQFWNYSQDASVYGPKLTLSDNGNIGIGTTTPIEKLSVNGKIRAHEIKVETVNWPDYVFDDDYKITSLSDLDKFIKINKHLPEMPSAKEVERNGIELGEMNRKLIEKIEELTLYIISQQKYIESQDKRLIKIENKLAN